MEELSGGISDAIVRLRAQPAILYYRVRSSVATDSGPYLKNWGRPLKSKVQNWALLVCTFGRVQ